MFNIETERGDLEIKNLQKSNVQDQESPSDIWIGSLAFSNNFPVS